MEIYIDIHRSDSIEFCYFERDYLGSIRAVTDADGRLLQSVDYHVSGNPVVNVVSDRQATNRLHTGKEFLPFQGVALYDNQARYYDPIGSRFLTMGPLCEKYPSLSPYSHCANNPLSIIDPTGRDVEVCIEDNNITITANIILEGTLATTDLAQIYKNDIMDNWGSITSFDDGGNDYNISWDINVRVAEKGEERDYNGIKNYYEVIDVESNSYVKNSNNGAIRSEGRNGKSLESDNPMSHEFGHILGLSDKYITNRKDPNYGKPINSSWEGNIMAEKAGEGIVTKNNMNTILIPAIIRHSIINSLQNRTDKTKYHINSQNKEPIQQ